MFANLLRSERTARKIGIKTLARDLGVSHTYISKLEGGKKMPSSEMVRSIAQYFGIEEETACMSAKIWPQDLEEIIHRNPKDSARMLRLMHQRQSSRFYDPLTPQTYLIPRQNQRSSLPSLPVISLFTGIGGLDAGLEESGFVPKVCVEIEENFRKTANLNFPHWPFISDQGGDITKISPHALLEFAGLRQGEAALVTGGAPCQPFSNIGKRLGAEHEGEGRLFENFVKVVVAARPAMFLFENVEGMTHAKHQTIIQYMQRKFEAIGYSVNMTVLDASWYGVPQRRKRLFVIGRRDGLTPLFPFRTHADDPEHEWQRYLEAGATPPWKFDRSVTVKDAFATLTKKDLASNRCLVMKNSEYMKKRMQYIKGNGNFKDLPLHMRPQCWKNGRHQGADTFGRLDLHKPSVTIRTCAYNPTKGRYIHPMENRGLNTLEMATLQSFPKQWRYIGSLVSVGKQIGNAVPFQLAAKLGEVLSEQVLEVWNV